MQKIIKLAYQLTWVNYDRDFQDNGDKKQQRKF